MAKHDKNNKNNKSNAGTYVLIVFATKFINQFITKETAS